MMAAATPAMTPEVNEMPNFVPDPQSRFGDALLCKILNYEFGDGVRDLLEQHGNEARVHCRHEAILLHHRRGRSWHRKLGHRRVRHLTNA